MKLIAHRGLIYGPNSQLENNPTQIESVLQKGFDAEVDVWYEHGQWFLGHDRPMYEIDFTFLQKPGLWIHAKNLDALYALGSTVLNYFWHQKDDFTLTSEGFIWTYPGLPLTAHSICVMPEVGDNEFNNLPQYCYGICSDYVSNPKFQQLITRN
jgi:hypothetical protein